jgi:hypothetical protein
MDTSKTNKETKCHNCNWHIYQGQEVPFRIIEKIVNEQVVFVPVFYCSENCFNYEEIEHNQTVS